MSELREIFDLYRKTVNDALDAYVPDDKTELSRAMRYSLLCGGKRIRPVITLAFCKLCGGDAKNALPFACAVEMVHTYSLIFDDMPAMDNDDWRRGQPSCHKKFGEAMAMLAGLGLYAKAFELTSSAEGVSKETSLYATRYLAEASGLKGIIPGQAYDIKNNGEQKLSYEEVLNIHRLKTSAMLECSAVLGAMAAGADGRTVEKAREYAVNVGLAFQIRDDILDVVSTSEKMGKTVGKDKIESKTTFVDIFGIDKSQGYVNKYTLEAKQILSEFSDSDFLVWLTDMLCNRES